ncbi:MAG: alpha/beta hydrolase [Gammaproteobacteria bacterium]|nr:MAG: alpha/beta hydrolase [Gammaproteobacteria bacterium]
MERKYSNLAHSSGHLSYLFRPATGGAKVHLHMAHANGFNARTYQKILGALPYEIEASAIDQRGHGQSTLPADPKRLTSWRIYEKDLLAYIDQQSQPVILAGHSMGGAISIAVAAARPEKVKALLLIDPVLPPELTGLITTLMRYTRLNRETPLVSSARKRKRQFQSPQAAVNNYVDKGAFKTWPREWIEDYVSGGTRRTHDGVELSCAPDWEAKNFAVAGNHPWPAIRKLTCPVTLLTASFGSTCPPAISSKFKLYHQETVVRSVAGASHFLPMEKPALIVDAINELAGKITR